ncbi:MAG: signal recognition particle-docking protein FtsY [Candidatus Kapaibacteriales bacterium]
MGFFDRFKKKVTGTIDKVTEKLQKVEDKLDEGVDKAVQATSEAVQFDKLKAGLSRTKNAFADQINGLLRPGRVVDKELLDEIEEILITADIGVVTAEKIVEELRSRVRKQGTTDAQGIYPIIKEIVAEILVKSPSSENDRLYQLPEENRPHTVLVIGVNGVGKTTTIGKLAYNYKQNGFSVVIGAADTFRAAANEQLEVWAKRADVEIIQRASGADPAAVAYDTMASAVKGNNDLVIIDTAGRLHNKHNLMQELEKMSRVMKKHKDTAPDDVFLVLDATTGQNAIQQAKEFSKVAPVTGIVLTKLDGTAKGGVVIAIASELGLPVRYIGVGEQINDLQPFDPIMFVEALFGDEKGEETILEENAL